MEIEKNSEPQKRGIFSKLFNELLFNTDVIDESLIIKKCINIASAICEVAIPETYKKNGKIERLYDLLHSEINSLRTFQELLCSKNGNTLELHYIEESNNEIDDNQLIHYVNANKVLETKKYENGVQWDIHGGVGYHFHYCKRINNNIFERSRYLLSYDTKENQHLGKIPTLYSEEHSEGKSSKDITLPSLDEEKYAIYHRCNSKRLEILKSDKNAPFRRRSNDASTFYP